MDKSLDELLEEHNKALEQISLTLNRILTQQEQIISYFVVLPDKKVTANQQEDEQA